MARAIFVKSARKDYPDIGVKKSESYWWWQFRFGGKHVSKTEPTRGQLTQSAFLISIYDIEDRLSRLTSEHSVKDEVDQIKNDLEELKSECEEKFGNIPEQLQESSAGQLLQERIDNLDDMISEIDNIDYDLDDDAVLDEKEAVIDDLSQISYQGS
jgi:predicted RNase H-like nuclease (RuvC/YqgF family)